VFLPAVVVLMDYDLMQVAPARGTGAARATAPATIDAGIERGASIPAGTGHPHFG